MIECIITNILLYANNENFLLLVMTLYTIRIY